ncbi:MAG: response regulator transcription factor [Chthoniobacteraceae bacterium]
MKNTILVVDDEQDVVRLLVSNLKRAGYETLTAEDGDRALARARSDKPDLMILDLMLPSISGLEVCRSLKGDPSMAGMPIIMLTARHEEIDRVVGFELGADDYVTKPFSPREMVLRVQSLLRRSTGWNQAAAPKSRQSGERESGIVKIGPIVLDSDRCEVRVQGRALEFSRIEFKLLSVLAKNPGKVHTREELLSEVWGYESDTETRTVDMHVLRVREKLGNTADCLETVRGFGYRITSQAYR